MRRLSLHNVVREMFDPDYSVDGQQTGPVEDVAQFPDITRP